MVATFVSIIAALSWIVVAEAREFHDPHCNGKQVIVHLFEWKWTDIADECERFLGPKGFCGVQVSPPMEHVMVTNPMRPWWERYQPVSYKLTSRSGNEAQFKDMVDRCMKVGVRIFVDAVINHMAGLDRKGTGTAGSHFDSNARDFPGVPYTNADFNRECPVNNYGDPNNVRDCYLVGLTDLNQAKTDVQDKTAGYLNHLIQLGVAGFRVDAAKHMWPRDIRAIQSKLKDVVGGGKPFFAHEVIDQNDGAIKTTEYVDLGWVSEFRYCQKIAWGIRDFGQLNNVVDYGWHMTDSADAFVFVDNHDNQRGHGGGGNQITFKEPRDYKMAVAFTLAYNYGFTRIMSSYYFDNSDQGPPHNADYSAKDVVIKSDGSCDNGWVCEHRWAPIANMVAFRNAVTGTSLDNWYNQGDVVAFSRGNKGFFVIAKHGSLDQTFRTGMPAGEYCDLISDCQQKITVDGGGNAHVRITNSEEPIVAIIVGGTNNGGSQGVHHDHVTTPRPIITEPPHTGPADWKRTVIFVQRHTNPGQDLFIRGGIDHSHRTGCTTSASTSACAIPIKHSSGSGSHYAKVNAWSQGDHFLDWHGREPGQGSYHGQPADGTPAVWTTNRPGRAGHTSLNTFGEHYWMVDVQMDCSKTYSGWFEIKAIVNGQWEGNLHAQKCTGTGSGSAPYSSKNHFARCGFLNVLHFSSGRCEINALH